MWPSTWRDIPISLVNALDRHALLACLSCKLSTAKAIASTTTVGNLADSIFIPSAVPDPRDDRSRRSDGSEIILNAPIGLRTDSGVRDIGVKRGEANGMGKPLAFGIGRHLGSKHTAASTKHGLDLYCTLARGSY